MCKQTTNTKTERAAKLPRTHPDIVDCFQMTNTSIYFFLKHKDWNRMLNLYITAIETMYTSPSKTIHSMQWKQNNEPCGRLTCQFDDVVSKFIAMTTSSWCWWVWSISSGKDESVVFPDLLLSSSGQWRMVECKFIACDNQQLVLVGLWCISSSNNESAVPWSALAVDGQWLSVVWWGWLEAFKVSLFWLVATWLMTGIVVGCWWSCWHLPSIIQAFWWSLLVLVVDIGGTLRSEAVIPTQPWKLNATATWIFEGSMGNLTRKHKSLFPRKI